MEQTLLRVKNLEKFIKRHGDDPYISQTISKMLDYKINQYKEKIKRLEKCLKKFERTYKKDSSTFFKDFNDGRTEDKMDFIEWASLYQMRGQLLEKMFELEGKR